MCYCEGIEYFISNVFRVSHFADGPLGLVSHTPAHWDQCILHGAEESLFWGKHACSLFTTSLRMKRGVNYAVKTFCSRVIDPEKSNLWLSCQVYRTVLSQSARLIACSHRCRLFFFKRMRSCRNPEKLDSRTGAIFTVHDATSRHFVLTRNSLVNTQFNGMEWTFWPRHAHCELRIFLWRIPWRGLYCSKHICVYYSIVQFYNYIQLYPHTYSKLTVNKLIYYTSTVWLFLSKLYRPGIKRYGTININMIFVKLLWNDVYCELFLTNLLNGWFSDSVVMQSRLWPPTGITV